MNISSQYEVTKITQKVLKFLLNYSESLIRINTLGVFEIEKQLHLSYSIICLSNEKEKLDKEVERKRINQIIIENDK